MDQPDAELLGAVCDGSERAFNELVDRHQQAVRQFLRRVAGANDADDLAQETFITVWAQARSFRGGAAVRTWIMGIAWRKAMDAQRRGVRRSRRDGSWLDARAGHTDFTADIEHALAQALDTLSLEQRAAIMLCLACEFSHGEAAEALQMPLGTVKSHVARGREQLREVLGGGT